MIRSTGDTRKYYRARPVNKPELIADKERLRSAIFTFGCYCKDKQFTIKDVMLAFDLKKQTAFNRVQELITRRLVRLTGRVEKGWIVYQIDTMETR